jgi:hypothetical protein
MSDEFHIFLSYRRSARWPAWVRDIFLPKLTHWLSEELGEDARIFFDQEMETGTDWQLALGGALNRARVLVPLWSRTYFNSNWCKAELAFMLAREEQHGFRTRKRPQGLIIPALIHDGNDLPEVVRGISALQLQRYTNPWLAERSPAEEELSNLLRDWAPDVAAAIRRAPAPSRTGRQPSRDAIERFLERLNQPEPRQDRVPVLGVS